MNKEFLNTLYQAHQECPDAPSPSSVIHFFDELLGTLFPDFARKPFTRVRELELHLQELQLQLRQLLFKCPKQESSKQEAVAGKFFQELPLLHTRLSQDVTAMYEGDPAAQSLREVIRTYPGFYAIAAYRVAHILHSLEVQVLPRIITEHAHSKTGVDIHPAAKIGDYFCIDHGTGIVIGETTEIGNHVKMYQGVTLGALSVNKEDAKKKRHPTIEDHVVLYAGATILGGETHIGHHSVIGGNVWVTRSLAPYTKVYYQAKMYNENTGEIDLVVFKEKS